MLRDSHTSGGFIGRDSRGGFRLFNSLRWWTSIRLRWRPRQTHSVVHHLTHPKNAGASCYRYHGTSPDSDYLLENVRIVVVVTSDTHCPMCCVMFIIQAIGLRVLPLQSRCDLDVRANFCIPRTSLEFLEHIRF